jgi:hypothetical protein
VSIRDEHIAEVHKAQEKLREVTELIAKLSNESATLFALIDQATGGQLSASEAGLTAYAQAVSLQAGATNLNIHTEMIERELADYLSRLIYG